MFVGCMGRALEHRFNTRFRSDDINIVVTGGETQGAFKMISGRYISRAGGLAGSKKPTSLIDDWR